MKTKKFCPYCGQPLLKSRNKKVKLYDRWWYSVEFRVMEIITGYRQPDFAPEDGSQAFADACDVWWEDLSRRKKMEYWKEYS